MRSKAFEWRELWSEIIVHKNYSLFVKDKLKQLS